MKESKDVEPKFVEECQSRNDRPNWRDARQEELNSLVKLEVFGPIVRTPENIKPGEYKWVIV